MEIVGTFIVIITKLEWMVGYMGSTMGL